MGKKTGRYSYLVRPITTLIDLLVINITAELCFNNIPQHNFLFHVVLSLGWIVSAIITSFYEVYRHTKTVAVLEKICKQFLFQFIFVAAYNGIFKRFAEPNELLFFGILSFCIISANKLFLFIFFKYVRKILKGNYRRVFLLGNTSEMIDLKEVLIKRQDLGYQLFNYEFEEEQVGLDRLKDFIVTNKIDEIFIPFSFTREGNFIELLTFADSQMINVLYVPTQKDIIKNNLSTQYYDFIPVVHRRTIPLDKPYNKLIKRVFDLVFSTLVIFFVLSWLVPLLAILIKKESKGPVFFKQKRTGLGDNEFWCYKFRSMCINETSDTKQATKNDHRVTKIGAFLRKTSLDEFPQFINVFLGDMSIVGPRPHMVVHTKLYSKRVNRFMLRHLVKPGITGMAQTHGYRGEIETDRDIINRFKYDLFYLENWSIILDLKIIYLTVYNVFKGEEKAY